MKWFRLGGESPKFCRSGEATDVIRERLSALVIELDEQIARDSGKVGR